MKHSFIIRCLVALLVFRIAPSVYADINKEAVADFNKGQEAYAKGQYSVALNYYLSAYRKGDDLLSPSIIADIYLKGQHNGTPNTAEGVRWMKIAADKNAGSVSGRVQCDLATYYYMGIGVPQDIQKAIYYYTLSANNEFGEAMYYLGLAYENGEGVAFDINKAIEWYKKAAATGHAGAGNNLSRIYGMSKYGIMNQEEAGKWALFAAERGDRNAQLTVGNFYLHGFIFPEDKQKAVYWLKKSAEQGVVQAQIILSELGY